MPVAQLLDFVILLGGAVAVALVSHRLRIPAVVGLLLAGLVIGPTGLGLVAERATVTVFAEIGVVFLLFSIGLEFSLERLREVRRPFFLGGTLQATLTLAAVAALAAAAGAGWGRGVFFGCLLTLSSTAVVLKLYAEREELEAPQGKLVIGILLFQDFLVVPMILVVPVLGGTVAASWSAVALRFALGALLVAAVFGAARYLMPRLLWTIVRTRVREVFVLGALFVCLGMALATESAGFSLALGGFLAGIIIAESDYSAQVAAEMAPFRDVFNSLFFISIGMLLRLDFVLAHWPRVLALVVGIVALKGALAFLAVRLLAFPARVAVLVGLALAQVGEFSFVVARAGERHGLLGETAMQYFLAAAVVSLMATPLLVAAAPRLGAWLQRGRGAAAAVTAGVPLAGHVVIVGFGVNGRNLARVLRETSIAHVVVELSGELVRAAKAAGERVIYGDATRRDILERCGVARASTVVFGISDPVAVRSAIRQTRALAPQAHLLVRTRRVAEIDDLYRCGADEVVAEEFESSIEIFTRVLQRYHVPTNVVRAQTRVLRGERYRMLRAPAPGAGVSARLLDLLAAGTTDVYRLAENSPVAGRTLRQLGLREESGASILVVVRGQRSHANPAADFPLESGDALVVMGSHAEVDQAFHYLDRLEQGGIPAETSAE